MAAYYCLLCLFISLDYHIPRLFMQLPASNAALLCYENEFIADLVDYLEQI